MRKSQFNSIAMQLLGKLMSGNGEIKEETKNTPYQIGLLNSAKSLPPQHFRKL
jgi:hypothetical protein